MKWQKPSEELILFLENGLKHIDCQSRKMFGCPAYFINNNMFIGAFRKDVFIRLSPEDKEKALHKYEKIKPFTPRPGMTMKEYLALPKTLYGQKRVFSELLKKSVKYARSLPPKKCRKKK
jgi:TfoX/Sxy family transcriptional regulator of competence genes